MKEEIAAAVVFIKRLVKKNPDLSEEQIENFTNRLSAILVDRFKNHWYKEAPAKGQGYRCIRVNEAGPVDPVLECAAFDSGLMYVDLKLPVELTLWVDPTEVCCRFSESGTSCTVASFKENGCSKVNTLDIDNMLDQQIQDRNFKLLKFHQVVNQRSNYRGAKTASLKIMHNLKNAVRHKKASSPTPNGFNAIKITAPVTLSNNSYNTTPCNLSSVQSHQNNDRYRWRNSDAVKA